MLNRASAWMKNRSGWWDFGVFLIVFAGSLAAFGNWVLDGRDELVHAQQTGLKAALDARYERLDERVNGVEKNIDGRLMNIEKKVGAIEKNMKTMEKNLVKISVEMAVVKTRQEDMQKDIGEIKTILLESRRNGNSGRSK